MMPVPTTTIRLPQSLRSRVSALAKRSGSTAHGFILEAIAEKAFADERQADFQDLGDERLEDIAASGKTIPWAEMRSYLEARIAGKVRARPRSRKLGR